MAENRGSETLANGLRVAGNVSFAATTVLGAMVARDYARDAFAEVPAAQAELPSAEMVELQPVIDNIVPISPSVA